jgi:ferredoxin
VEIRETIEERHHGPVYKVRVEPFGHTFSCGEDETILEAAQRDRVFLRYGCKNGACGTCKVQILDGDVDLTASSYALLPAERDNGTILVCQSYPVDDCVIDVEAMNLEEDEFHGRRQRRHPREGEIAGLGQRPAEVGLSDPVQAAG